MDISGGKMKKYIVLMLSMIVASGCAGSVATKSFKVFTEPSDAAIKVVSGVELKEQKYTPPASITVEVPTDPALANKAVLEVARENYKPKTIALSSIKDGDILNLKLEKILRDAVRYKLSCRLVRPVASKELKYRDKLIAISFVVEEQSLQMQFENLSEKEVSIRWEQAMYTDVNGQTQRLMHSGIRFLDRNNPLPAQVVKSHASVQESVIPVGNVFMSPEKKGYDIRPLFPVLGDASALKGKAITLSIPVEFNHQVQPYNFNIEIVDAVKEAVKE
jgi:PBP1b-binding outer membrane lipoprotein LpoB